MKLEECVVLPHCEREGVKLTEAHTVPLWLVVTENEVEEVKEDDCVPLGLLIAEALRAAVAQALSVALSHCERDDVKLEESVALPLCEREGVKLGEYVALPHCELEGV